MAARESAQTEEIIAQISAPTASVVELLSSYRGEMFAELWRRNVRLYEAFVRRLIARGHPTRAFELAREALGMHTDNLQLRFLAALALARGGNISKAGEELDDLLGQRNLSPALRVEAQSLRGRLFKDRYQRARSAAARKKLAAESARLYADAYRNSHDWFPGINAATMSLLAGNRRAARQIAKQVIAQARRAAAKSADDVWLSATLGEAHLIIGDLAEATRHYKTALAAAAGRTGDIASIRRNVRLLAAHVDVGEIPTLFYLGNVVVFSGHMIDHPDRELPRFPASASLEKKVARAIAAELDRLQATVGFSSAAAGSDILFAEAMLARGAELHIVLPFAQDDFYSTSVDFGRTDFRTWRERCDAVLQRATQIHLATEEKYLGDDVLLDFGNSVMQGLAITRARELEVEPHAVIVAEPGSRRLLGGTAHFLHRWRAAGRHARVIDLSALRDVVRPTSSRAKKKAALARRTSRRPKRQIHSMLFADVKNFSKLTEEQAPSFFVTFLNGVADIIARSKRQPVFANTWGDGLFLVFNRVVDCADLALRLLDRIGSIDWEKLDLPSDTTVRMGLHAGPVYPRVDKIIRRTNFFGSHVNRAARIEPVTTPGCAFTSDQFAALLAMEPGHSFVCEYVGVEDLAKEYARCPLYRLARA